MIVVMSHCATEEEIKAVSAWLEREGFQIHLSRGVERTIIGAIGDRTRLAGSGLEAMQSVERVVPILQPYKLASRTFQAEDTIIRAGGLEIGGTPFTLLPVPARWKAGNSFCSQPGLSGMPAPRCCGAGLSSPGPHPIPFRAWRRKV